MSKNNVVVFDNITKQFGDITANDGINFAVEKNEVHALLGENGAGKSTLMSILFGLYKPTKGNIYINGELVRIKTPRHANKLKIAMLPQHFKLVDNMSVLENIMLGYEITLRGLINKKAARNKIEKAKAKYNIKINLDAQVGKLSVSDKQKVELLKILWGEAEIIIFDEPTSILTPKEIEEFLKLILNLKSSGKTILLITHKLPEIKAISDRVSIIRKGKYIKTVITNTVSEKQLANLMVGKEVDLNLSTISRKPVNEEITVLDVKNISYKGTGFQKSLFDSSFVIKSGEILGIAAIEGNGQSELLKVISGIFKSSSGTINITQHDVTNKSIKEHYYTSDFYTNVDSVLRIKKIHQKFLSNHEKSLKNIDSLSKNQQLDITGGAVKDYSEMSYYWSKNTSLLSHIPEDRHEYGLILDYSVAKNVVLQDLKYFSNRFGILDKKSIQLRLDYIKEKYDVRGIQSYKTKVKKLSGGNQQKLILGREIERGSNLLLAVHPTRGLDVGAIRNVYENIINARNQGSAVLLSSGELDEIMQVSDRIIVLYEGKIVSISKRGELSKLELGTLMSTGKKNSYSQSKQEILNEPEPVKEIQQEETQEEETQKIINEELSEIEVLEEIQQEETQELESENLNKPKIVKTNENVEKNVQDKKVIKKKEETVKKQIRKKPKTRIVKKKPVAKKINKNVSIDSNYISKNKKSYHFTSTTNNKRKSLVSNNKKDAMILGRKFKNSPNIKMQKNKKTSEKDNQKMKGGK